MNDDVLESLRDALRDGDPEAYRSLLRLLSEPLYRYVRPMVGDDSAAQDVVQQAFIRVFKNRARLQAQGSLRTFCFFVATNLVRDARRDNALRQTREAQAAEQAMRADNASGAEWQMISREAWQSAMNLPEELREIVLLRFGQGFSAAEAAVALGIPEGTVKARQRTALERLRASLASYAAAPLVAMDTRLETALAESAGKAVPVPTSLAISVETWVMASISVKVGAGVVPVILVVLLLMGAAGGVWVLTRPNAVQNSRDNAAEEMVARGDSGSVEADAGKAPAVNRPAVFDGKAETGDGAKLVAEKLPVPTKDGGADNKPVARTRTIIIKGRVNEGGADNKPVAGAQLWLEGAEPGKPTLAQQEASFRRMNLSGPTALDDFTDDYRDADAAPVQALATFARKPDATTSAADGSYELRAEVQGTSSRHVLKLHAEAVGFAPWETDVVAENGQAELSPFLQKLGRHIVFRTEPPADGAVDGWISTRSDRTSSYGGLIVRLRDGAYFVDHIDFVELPKTGAKVFTLDVKGHGPVDTNYDDTGEQRIDLGTIKLPKGREISGVVLDETGTPQAGAMVRAGHHFMTNTGDCFMTTGADGSFKGAVSASFAGCLAVRQSNMAECRLEVAPGADDIRDVRLVLMAGTTVTVSVHDGNGVPSKKCTSIRLCRKDDVAQVARYKSNWKPAEIRGVQPDESGECRFEHVGPGEYSAWAVMDDGGVLSREILVERQPLSLVIEAETDRRGRIEGCVLGADHKPLVRARVCLFSPGASGAAPETRTDKDGRYVFEGLEPGSYRVLLREHDHDFSDAQMARRSVEVSNGAKITLDIDLSVKSTGNALSGRILVDGSAKFDDVFVCATGTSSSLFRGALQPDGRFELGSIPPGDYYVWFRNKRNTLFYRLVVRFADWNGVESIDKNLSTTTLEINVTGPGETAVCASVHVSLANDQPFGPEVMAWQIQGNTDVKGHLSLTGIFEGGCWVRASGGGGKATACTRVDTTREKAVTLNLADDCGGADITLANIPAVYASDKALRGQFLCFEIGGAQVRQNTVMMTGEQPLELRGLAPGRYRILLAAGAILPAEAEITVRSGQNAAVTLELKPAASVVIVAKDGTLPPGTLEGAGVEIFDEAGNVLHPFGRFHPMMGGPKSANGREIGPLAAGSYRVVAKADGYAPVEGVVDVKAGERATLTLAIKKN